MFRTASIADLLAWPTPNYTNPETRGPAVYWISGIFLFAATFCVVVRLYTRIFVRRYFGIDDALLIFGYFCSAAVTALVAIGTHSYGWDRHLWDLPQTLYAPSVRILYYSRIAWGLAASSTRLSVLAMYYRLLKSCEAPRRFFWITHTVTAASVIMFFYYLCSGVFPCWPIDAYWSWPPRPGDECWDDAASFQGAAIVNTLLEAVVATMPLVAIFHLRVNKAQRWDVMGVLSLGYFVALAGILRTVYIFKIATTFDISWYAVPQWVCSEVENDLALICACAAPLRPVLGRTLRRFKIGQISISRIQKPSITANTTTSSSWGSRQIKTMYARDPESAAEWNTAMSRTIDLEGISVDDLGYKVRISGPTKAEKKSLARRRVRISLREYGLTRRVTSKDTTQEIKQPFDIHTQNDLDVRVSIHSELDGYAAWGATPAEGRSHRPYNSNDVENSFPQIRNWGAAQDDLDKSSLELDEFTLPIQHPA